MSKKAFTESEQYKALLALEEMLIQDEKDEEDEKEEFYDLFKRKTHNW